VRVLVTRYSVLVISYLSFDIPPGSNLLLDVSKKLALRSSKIFFHAGEDPHPFASLQIQKLALRAQKLSLRPFRFPKNG